MFNKPKDIPYCGCDIDKIKKANPKINLERLKLYVYYQWERTNIYYKKEILKQPRPWTDDEILNKYRFTNTRRELDKESKWLINNILNRADISYENKLLNAFLFRLINKHETFETVIKQAVGDVYIDFNLINDNVLNDIDELVKNSNTSLFNSAYMLSGVMKPLKYFIAKKYPKYVDYKTLTQEIIYLNLFKDYILQIAELPPNIFKAKIAEIPGFTNNFLPYQIWVDWTYIGAYTPDTNDFYPYSENEFVLSGVGCHRGIMWLIDNDINNLDGLTEEEFIFWFRDNLPNLAEANNLKWSPKAMFHFLPESQQNWSVMCIENSFCEFDKYCRTFYGKKRPKRIYKPQSEQEMRTLFSSKSKIKQKSLNLP